MLNDHSCELIGETRENLLGKSDYDFFPKEQSDVFTEKDRKVLESGETDINEEIITRDNDLHIILTKKSCYKDKKSGKKFIVGSIRDITKKKELEEERSKLIENLTNSLKKVKLLKGLLPICASCKKIRDDKGYWKQLEEYIESHSDALFSHSLCPKCTKTFLNER